MHFGLFSNKHRKPVSKEPAASSPPLSVATNDDATTFSSDSRASPGTSASRSPAAEYVQPDIRSPTAPNGQRHEPYHSSIYPTVAASSSRLKLPFTRGRKVFASASASGASGSVISLNTSNDVLAPPPVPNYISRRSTTGVSDVASEELTPPRKSAIFRRYGDSHNLSTRSLPSDGPPRGSQLSASSTPTPKKISLFHWSKSAPSSAFKVASAKSKSDTPPQLDLPEPSSSFNLKSFRHLGPPSSATSSSSVISTPSPAVPLSRPRNLSVASDSSQRISVAAFREAQARRSMAGSPSPSFRSPSPGPGNMTRGTLNTNERPMLSQSPRSNRAYSRPVANSGTSPVQSIPRRSFSPYRSESEESADDESQEDDSSDSAIHALGRKRTITQRRPGLLGGKSVSENDHGFPLSNPSRVRPGFAPPPRSQSVMLNDVEVKEQARSSATPRSSSSLGTYQQGPRQRASVSTSALSPNAAAKRASIIAQRTSDGPGSHHRRSSTVTDLQSAIAQRKTDSGSESDDSDDMPLAKLRPPMRPSSAASTSSRGSLNTRKPLLDINEITSRKPETAVRRTTNDEAFTSQGTLLSGSRTVVGDVKRAHLSLSGDSGPSIPLKFVSPSSSPTKTSITLPAHANTWEVGSSNAATAMPASTARAAARQPLRRFIDQPSAPESNSGREPLTTRLTRVFQNPASTSDDESSSSSSSSEEQESSRPKHESQTTVVARPASEQRKSTSDAKTMHKPAVFPSASTATDSDVDEYLLAALGGGVRLITRYGEDEAASPAAKKSGRTPSLSDLRSEEASPGSAQPVTNTATATTIVATSPLPIPPIPIKRRMPAPSFSVTSRPRSMTLSATSESPTSPTMPIPKSSGSKEFLPPRAPVPSSSPSVRPRSTSMAQVVSPPQVAPFKPFATRMESPASSTGDSSSGRAPLTPRDGSDVGSDNRTNGSSQPKGTWGSGVSGLGMNGPRSNYGRRSVTFSVDDDAKIKSNGKSTFSPRKEEQRRNERRRTEAKAAIELGNVINGPGPVVSDDNDHPTVPSFDPRMSMVNPMMSMNMGMGFPATSGTGGWGMWPPGQMYSPSNVMMPPPTDPAMMAAHQQAMMYAKQAYQMMVAQQAMVAAGEEWERGSAYGGGGSVYGGSVYGGGSPPAIPQYNMRMSMAGGMWGTPGMFPGGAGMRTGMYAQSEVAGPSSSRNNNRSSSRSEIGGPTIRSALKTGQAKTGPSGYVSRESGYAPPVPSMPASSSTNLPATTRPRTTSQPGVSPGPHGVARRAPPPSSWKRR
ncbi:hypothetical protein FISHEDRAFT_71562 [Fistulina hepatica ATCC 64428]|uniref:Uncharacterized protein n=1 Tax=Fistulina hepatica ATCC 64428 TaxID=1128425 RepID=A0A0D7AGG2_9AGAR|nr:hypothetical protein FISHEDRAFT_71562 [Fistulina hepatica ATCC 64428]